MDLRLFVSLHSEHFNKTPSERFGVVENNSLYQNAELLIDELVAHVQAGKAWAGCHFEGGKRNASNAGASNLIVLDIDGDTSLEDFWAISFVERHCLLTYTSCSHNPDGEHRFRALFCCEQHDQPGLHQAIYRQVVDSIGFTPKDAAGEKPERLWYGNTNAEVHSGGGALLNWDLIERAKDQHQRDDAKRRLPKLEVSGSDQQLDNERAAYALRHLLRASSDGDFHDYWSRLLNAAAATGSELVRDAFLDWHSRGHHGKTQRGVEKRFDKAGTVITAGQGAGQILSFAKAEHGSDWKLLLPQHLRYWHGMSGAAEPIISIALPIEEITDRGFTRPISLFSSRSPADTAADGAQQAPDLVPPLSELERLAHAAQPILLMASRGPDSKTPDRDTAPPQSPPQSEQIEQLLAQLYTVETERKLLTAEGEKQLTAQEARYKADQLESELQAFPVFRTNQQRIRTRLLELFCDCNQINQRNDYDRQLEPLLSSTDQSNEYLIDGFMVRGASYLIYSLPGIGKTSLSLLLCRAALGTPAHDKFLGFQATPAEPFSCARAIYIASDGGLFAKGDAKHYVEKWGLENDEWTNYVKVYSAHRKNNASPWKMNLRGLYQLVTDLNRMAAAGTPVRLLIIDSLKACVPEGVLIGDQVLARYLEVIEGICGPRDITTVYLTHQSKDSDNPQGIAALTEMVHGYFRIKIENNQHHFCITKLRDGKSGRREIPYKISASGDLLMSDPQDDDESNSNQILIKVFAEHYSKHLKLTDHLDPCDPQRSYRGVQRSDVLLLLRERGLNDPAWRNAKRLDRALDALVKSGKLRKPEYGRYAIGHAAEQDPIRQAKLDLGETKTGECGPDAPDIGSAPSSGVTQEVLCPFLEGEQEQSEDDCLEADCTAPLTHYAP
jgi:hypothetical protein